MKSFIAAIVILVLLIGFGLASYVYLDKTAEKLVHETELLEESVHKKDWKAAEKNFASLTSSWDKSNEKWTMLIDHQELDRINTNISKIREYIQVRHLPELAAELAELKLFLLHIPQKEAINLDNLL